MNATNIPLTKILTSKIVDDGPLVLAEITAATVNVDHVKEKTSSHGIVADQVLKGNLTGNTTGNVTGNVSGSAGSVTRLQGNSADGTVVCDVIPVTLTAGVEIPVRSFGRPGDYHVYILPRTASAAFYCQTYDYSANTLSNTLSSSLVANTLLDCGVFTFANLDALWCLAGTYVDLGTFIIKNADGLIW